MVATSSPHSSAARRNKVYDSPSIRPLYTSVDPLTYTSAGDKPPNASAGTGVAATGVAAGAAVAVGGGTNVAVAPGAAGRPIPPQPASSKTAASARTAAANPVTPSWRRSAGGGRCTRLSLAAYRRPSRRRCGWCSGRRSWFPCRCVPPASRSCRRRRRYRNCGSG